MKISKNGIIAFCGSKFSGKSTSAILFKDLIGAPTEEIAIAGHLKEATARVFQMDMNLFLDPSLKEVELENLVVLETKHLMGIMEEFDVSPVSFDKHVRPHLGRIMRTPRALLQYIGTEVLHPIDPLIHIKKAIRKKDHEKLTIITDLRFVAEFEYLITSTISFLPAYVKNTKAEIRASTDGHASERQFELFRHRCTLLDNEGSMANLSLNISNLIKENYE